MLPRSRTVNPTSIGLETSSFCQLKCPSCPTATGAIKDSVGFGFLRAENFTNLIDQNPQIRHIELSNYGEMFLNPQLVEVLRYAHEKNVDVTAYNGVNLNHASEDVLEALVKYEMKTITVSLDGATQETYQKYRVEGNIEDVLDNVRKIRGYKAKYGTEFPQMKWQFVVFGHNEHEIALARQMAEDLDMKFYLKLSWDDDLSPVANREALEEEFGAWSRKQFQEKTGRVYLDNICNQLWLHPQINWDGKVLGCCRNFWGDFGGNVFTDGLSAAINNPKIRYARAMLNHKKPAREDIPCAKCDIYLARQK